MQNNNIDQLTIIFRDHFQFNDSEIEGFINQILHYNDQNLIEALAGIMREFISGHNSKLNKKERSILAKEIIENCLDIYSNENVLINQQFVRVLQMAKTQSIDIYRFAIKTNIRSANIEKFSKSLYALCKKRYFDKNTNSFDTLFKQEEVASVINDCAYIACKLNENNIQNVLSLLSDLTFDKETNKYIVNPKALIKKNKSLLLVNPKRLEENIKFIKALGQSQGLNKNQILNEIILSPSILTINHNKLAEFELVYKAGLLKILPNNAESDRYAQKIAHETAYSFSKLNTIQNIKLDNIEKNITTLERFIGKENTIGFSKNLSFLAKNPKFVEYLMLRASQEENKGIENFRKYIVEHSSNLTNDNQNENPIKKREMKLDVAIASFHKNNYKVTEELPETSGIDDELKNYAISGKMRKQVEDIIEKYKHDKLNIKKDRKTKSEDINTVNQVISTEEDFEKFILNFDYLDDNYPTFNSLSSIYPIAKALEKSGQDIGLSEVENICKNVAKLGANHDFYKSQIDKIVSLQSKIKAMIGMNYKKDNNKYNSLINENIEKYYELVNGYMLALSVECDALKNNITRLSNCLKEIGVLDENEIRAVSERMENKDIDIDLMLTTFWTLAGKYRKSILNKAKVIFGSDLIKETQNYILQKRPKTSDFCPGINLSFYNDFLFYVEKDYTGEKIDKYDLFGKINLDNVPNYKKYYEMKINAKFKKHPLIKSTKNDFYLKEINTESGKIYYKIESENPCFVEYAPKKFKKFASEKNCDTLGIINDINILSSQSDDFLDFVDNFYPFSKE